MSEHTDTLGVRPEAKLSVSGKQRRAPIITSRLGGDEGVNLQSRFCDEHTEAPFAVVAHLACSVGVSHFVLFLTAVIGQDCMQVLLEAGI